MDPLKESWGPLGVLLVKLDFGNQQIRLWIVLAKLYHLQMLIIQNYYQRITGKLETIL